MFNRVKYPIKLFSTRLIAHRANCGDDSIPENTLAAIQIAYHRGIKWIECDVKLTSDGIIIVIHDDTLKRTTNANGQDAEKLISEMTYAEIAKFDAGLKYSNRFIGEKIPTLIQFLHLIKKLNMGLILEIKPISGLEIETAIKTIEILERCHFLDYPKLLIQSFFVECLQEVTRLNSKLNTGLLLEEWGAYTRVNTGILRYPTKRIYLCKEGVEDILRSLHCTALVANHSILNLSRITKIKEKTDTSYVFAWTVNDPQKAMELYSYGVDAVISDHPERFALSKYPLHLFARNLTLFNSVEKLFLAENRHQDAKLQREYDNRFGLVLKKS
jgi:glycerophosphoryl diester phosphodiesterase